jgi:hypothetical protein
MIIFLLLFNYNSITEILYLLNMKYQVSSAKNLYDGILKRTNATHTCLNDVGHNLP